MTNMSRDDLRFVEPPYVEAFQANELQLHDQFGEHLGLPVIAGGEAAWIDAEIAELVFLMWRAGIRTTESCQDLHYNGTKTFIGFEEPKDLELFLSLAVPEDDIRGGLHDRATGCNLAPFTAEEDMWTYDLIPSMTKRRAHLHTCVEFPPSDVPELVRRLKAIEEISCS